MLTTLLTLSLFTTPAFPASQDEEKEIRLIVLVVVDQMIPEQLDRLEPWFSGGFRRFADGQVWTRAEHAHGATETGPGHATLGTGMHPSRNGIVGNGWLVPDTGESVYCAGDPSMQLLTTRGVESGDGRSPANLLVGGIADFVRAAHPDSRSVGVSGKDRAAILTLGQEADIALWWDRRGRGFVSSSYYGEKLPEWALDWNASWANEFRDYVWEDYLPEGIDRAGTAPDARPGEASMLGQTYPHPAPALSDPPAMDELALFSRWAYSTPLVDRFAIEMAEGALMGWDLGADEATDYLMISLSACDVVGHAFGPYSREVTDVLLSADEALGELFAKIDERVGEDRWIAGLSSDHGVPELVESLRPRGVPAHRTPLGELPEAMNEVRQTLHDTFGKDYVTRFDLEGMLFSEERIRADGIDPEEVHALAAELMAERVDWIERGFTREELERYIETGEGDPLVGVMARSFHPDRSLHVRFVQKPWYVPGGGGTTHGSPWPYDRRVPLAFFGPGFASGRRYEPCLTVDAAPTLLDRAGIALPEGLDGRVLE